MITSADRTSRLASSDPCVTTPGKPPPSIFAIRVVGAIFASSRERCHARMPGPAIRSPTASGVATTIVDIRGGGYRVPSLPHKLVQVDAAPDALQNHASRRRDHDADHAISITG